MAKSEYDGLTVEEAEILKTEKRKFRGLKTRVTSNCKPDKLGINAVKYQLEHLKNNPNTTLPFKELTHARTVQAYTEGIEDHLEKVKEGKR